MQRAPEKAAAIALLTAAAFRPTELLVGSAGPFCLLLLLARAAFAEPRQGALRNFNYVFPFRRQIPQTTV